MQDRDTFRIDFFKNTIAAYRILSCCDGWVVRFWVYGLRYRHITSKSCGRVQDELEINFTIPK